jgi:ribonuclease Z
MTKYDYFCLIIQKELSLQTMEKFEVNILGCGSALPTTRHFASSQVVNIREKLFMIDCGEGAQLQLRRSKLKFTRLNHIFISHLHGDHCFGLMGLISTFGLLGRTATLHIYAHEVLEKLLAPQLEYFCKGMTYEVAFHSINPNQAEVIYDDRSVSVTTIPLKHRIPTCGFLFQEKQTPNHIIRDMVDFYRVPVFELNRIKNGEDYVTPDGTVVPNHRLTTPSDPPRSYAYCSDTAYLKSIVPQIKGVDLLFHEGTFAQCDAARAKETYHTTAAQAAEIALEAEAKQLVIGHFSARYEDESILLKEAQAIFPSTLLAKENLRITL